MAQLKNTLFSKLRNTTSSLVQGLKQKARSRTAIGLAMLFTAQAFSSYTGKVYADPSNGKIIAKNNMDAAAKFIKVAYGEHYMPGKDAAVDAVVARGNIIEGIKDIKGEPLSVDSLYNKAMQNKSEKEKLFSEAYQNVRQQAMPDTVDNDLNITLVSPIGDSFDDILRTSKVKMRQLSWDDHAVLHKGLDLMSAINGKKVRNQVGVPVNAVEDGVITHSGITNRGHTGNIKIKAGRREYSYMHIKTLKEMGGHLKVGDSVKAGDIITEIAPMRRGERSQAPHLHFESYLDGRLQITAANNMIKNNGFMGQLTDSKFTKDIGWYMQAQLLNDSEGESFNAIPDKLDNMVEKGAARLSRKSSKRNAVAGRKLMDTYKFRMKKYDFVSEVIEQAQKQVFAAQHQDEEKNLEVALGKVETPRSLWNDNLNDYTPKTQMAATPAYMFKESKKDVAAPVHRYEFTSTNRNQRWTYNAA